MNDRYHDESYGEQMEAQHGPYSNDAPLAIDPRDVDAALRRIKHMVLCLPERDERERLGLADIKRIITEERERLGLPAEVKV